MLLRDKHQDFLLSQTKSLTFEMVVAFENNNNTKWYDIK